jgi:Flp pilus assembly protein TadG
MRLPVLRRGSTRSRGQALVEFAFVLPIFLLILMILLDFGRVIFAQYTITQDAREASRVGAVQAEDSLAKYAAIRAAALGSSPGTALTGLQIRGEDGTGGGNSACPDQDTINPNDNFYPDGPVGGGRVVVNIQVVVSIVTPVISNVLGGSFKVCAQSVSFVQ